MTLEELFNIISEKANKSYQCFLCNEFGSTRMYFRNAKISHKAKTIAFIGDTNTKAGSVSVSKLYSAAKRNMARCADYKIVITTSDELSLNGNFIDMEGPCTNCVIQDNYVDIYFDDEF